MQLLIDVGANLEAHDCHFGTPLHVACAREHLDCAKLLLKAGMAATGFSSGWCLRAAFPSVFRSGVLVEQLIHSQHNVDDKGERFFLYLSKA